MTLEEAQQIREETAKLYNTARAEYFQIYYNIYNKSPGDDAFDSYIQSRWEESKLADAFYQLGSSGYRQLIADGWNPTIPKED